MMNLNNTQQTQLQLLPRDNRLDIAFETIDELHTLISEGNIEGFGEIQSRAELVKWLRDVIYTAQETIMELESDQDEHSSDLRVVSSNSKLIVLERAD